MKNVFHNSTVLEAEKKIIAKYNIPSLILMENAGGESAKIIWDYYLKEKCTRIVILAGKGNNAGDGFVIARHLISFNDEYDGYAPVTIFMFYPEKELKGDALTNYKIIKELYSGEYFHITHDPGELTSYSDNSTEKILFVDAVYGVGFKGRLDENAKGIFSDINKYADNKFVIAIDIPSGLDNYNDASECLKADVTISMGVRKFNTLFYSGREFSGDLKIIDIGINSEEFTDFNGDEIYLFEKEDLHFEETIRSINSHKYNNGKLFILAGSEGYSGAAYMSAQSALRAGCGAVILGIPESLNPIMESKTTEVITLPLKSEKFLTGASQEMINEKIKWCDAILIGPGIGRHHETMSFVRDIILMNEANFIIDADAIFALKGHLDILRKEDCKIILTPHMGEFANLLDIETEVLRNDFIKRGQDFALKYNVTLVLKNSPSVTFYRNKVYINSTGRENLATVGSGDVLAGIIGAYFSQMKDTWAAMSGVYIHGYCGDIMFRKYGDSGTIASEITDLIPAARTELIKDYKKFH
jgi:ADP-dependent NAD(P)H-hydrate dehydratase / NAD(P)H-hydrate epimerase